MRKEKRKNIKKINDFSLILEFRFQRLVEHTSAYALFIVIFLGLPVLRVVNQSFSFKILITNLKRIFDFSGIHLVFYRSYIVWTEIKSRNSQNTNRSVAFINHFHTNILGLSFLYYQDHFTSSNWCLFIIRITRLF